MASYKEVPSSTEGRLFIRSSKSSDTSAAKSYFEPRPIISSNVLVRPTLGDLDLVSKGSDQPKIVSRSKRLRHFLHRPSHASAKELDETRSCSTMEPDAELGKSTTAELEVSIELVEPVLFLRGFDDHDTGLRNITLLRGTLRLRVLRNVRLKEISLTFGGVAKTQWPEAWRVRQAKSIDREVLLSHTWPFFNAQFLKGKPGHGADNILPLVSTCYSPGGDVRSSHLLDQTLTYRAARDLTTDATCEYRTFPPGEYVYNFELPIHSRLPETIHMPLGTVSYELVASVLPHGKSQSRTQCTKEVLVIRMPSEDSLETVEPIIISNSQNNLSYQLVVHGKSFFFGGRVPMSIKLRPKAGGRWHSIKMFLMEHVEYRTRDERMHRSQSTRKARLFEKVAADNHPHQHGNALRRNASHIAAVGELLSTSYAGATIVEKEPPLARSRTPSDPEAAVNQETLLTDLDLQLPSCRDRAGLHFDTTYRCISVRHSLKVRTPPPAMQARD